MTKNKSLEQAENLLHELVKEWKVEYSDFNAREGKIIGLRSAQRESGIKIS